MFTKLGILSSFRGVHSTGVIKASKKHYGSKKINYDTIKMVENPVTFLLSEEYHDFNKGDTPCTLMGHSRHATFGSVNEENAHPHTINNIIGMHNGSISSLYNKDDDTSDSYNLFKLISSRGVKALNGVGYGAYAITYIDKDKGLLVIARNNLRPLHYMKITGNTILWASEGRMLGYIRSMYPHLKNCDIEEFEQGYVHTLEVGSNNVNFKKFSLTLFDTPPTKSIIKPKEQEVTTIHPRVQKNYEGPVKVAQVSEYPYGPFKKEEKVLALPPPPQKKEERTNGREETDGDDKFLYKHFRGAVTSTRRAKELLSKGCCYCNNDTCTINESVLWIDHEEYLCEKCRHDPEIRSLHNGYAFPSTLIRIQ